MNAINWVATLSDGTTATELQGEYKLIPGERKPWIRLCNKLASEGKYLTSLRLNIDGRTIHLPRLKNNKLEDRFESVLPPTNYSLCYYLELDDILGNRSEKHYIDLAAHYDNFAVHYIQDITDGNNSWVLVTDNFALAPTPPKTEET